MEYVRAVVLAYFAAAGYPSPQVAAIDRYISGESGYDHLVQAYTGACLLQWAGSRRWRVTHGGGCPPLKVQLAIADNEIRTDFRCFFAPMSAGQAYAVFRSHFGWGRAC